MTRRLRAGLILAAAVYAVGLAGAEAQLRRTDTVTRRTATVEALLTYPIFYNGQPVRVRAELFSTDTERWLLQGSQRIRVFGQAVDAAAGERTDVDVTGTFYDVGRLEPNDPRLSGLDIARVAEIMFRRDWPAPGELPIVVAERVEPAAPPPAPTLRSVAADPDRYTGQNVTITGRFRGRNLFGDLPDAPGKSRWDFVLQSGDAAVWVTGRRPRGQGFSLDVDSRVDTNRWLEVAGLVRTVRGMVILEATDVRTAQEPEEVPAVPVSRVPTQGPRPEVIFSAPTQDETDVELGTSVRIQFSRDMNPESFKGQVITRYLESQARERGEPQAPPLPSTARYLEGNRVLEITFPGPLERFRTVEVQLLEGITALDGAPLVPWTLTFTLGGS